MGDTSRISVDSFKTTLFVWEVIITVIVFTAAYFILRGFKRRENAAREKNRKYLSENED